jgi:hypothetical protein
LIAHIIPTQQCLEQTLDTLKFAGRTKNILQRVRKFQVNAQDDATINRLQQEINFLKGVLLQTAQGAQANEIARITFENKNLRKLLNDKKQIIERIADNERKKRQILDRSFRVGQSSLDAAAVRPVKLETSASADTLNLDDSR